MRKRIVINLDSPEAAAQRGRATRTKSRRGLRVLVIIFGLFLVIATAVAVGGFFWWRNYQTTPAYTLALIVDAAQRNDLPEFQKRIDNEEVAKSMIATVSQKAAARYGFALSGSMQQRIDSLLPSLTPRLKQAINDEVAKELKDVASKSEPKPFLLLAATLSSIVNVTTEGDSAKATTSMLGRPIELTMRRDADRWKVTEYKDEVVVQRVVDSVIKELPAIGSIDNNSSLLKQLSRPNRPRRRR
jgi:nitrate reductase NapE component